jgi:hypothetical protein
MEIYLSSSYIRDSPNSKCQLVNHILSLQELHMLVNVILEGPNTFPLETPMAPILIVPSLIKKIFPV